MIDLLVVYAMNLVYAFMAPTWSVLALFHIVFGVEALPLALAARSPPAPDVYRSRSWPGAAGAGS